MFLATTAPHLPGIQAVVMYLTTVLFGALFSYSFFASTTLSTPLTTPDQRIHNSTGENVSYATARSVNQCTQVQCQVSVCAVDGMDAWVVASNGLQILMGEDCGGWQSGPNEGGQGPCASGLYEYSGTFTIWRAWVVGSSYSGIFAQWSNFLGAICSGVQAVSCSSHDSYTPNTFNGECYYPR